MSPGPWLRRVGRRGGRYRVRVGVYRIVYQVIDDRLIVHLVRIGHRRDVYRS